MSFGINWKKMSKIFNLKTLLSKFKTNISDFRCFSRIVGGQDAEKGSHPWQAALVFRGRSKPFCGGSLVTTR